jgi:type I restriction enzyme S subunit
LKSKHLAANAAFASGLSEPTGTDSAVAEAVEFAGDDDEAGESSAYPPSVQSGIPRLGDTPDGWVRLSIGELLEPAMRPAKINGDGEYQLVTAKRSRAGIVPRERLHGRDIKTRKQFFIEAEDFLISRRQISHGACGIVPASLSGAIVSNEYAALKAKPGLDRRFLRHLTHSVYFQQTCFHSSIGVHVEKLVFKLEDWLEWEFDVPSLIEQRRITNVLDAWDRAINQTERLIAAIDRRKSKTHGLLFEGTTKDWQAIPISGIGECFAGGTPPRERKQNFGGGIPWVKSGEVTSFRIARTEETLSAEGLNLSSAKWAPRGSTLVAMYGANAGQVGRLEIDATTNQAVLAIVPYRNIIDCRFLYYTILRAVPGLMRKTQGSGQPNLSAGIIKAEKILVPDLSTQRNIASVLIALDDELTCLDSQLTRMRIQQRGLAQKLLTGEWRLGRRFDLPMRHGRLVESTS